MDGSHDTLRVGEQVILLRLPPGFLDDLPDEDVRAISAMIGSPVTLVEYDDVGRAQLDFVDPITPEGGLHTHTIWVAPAFIRPLRT